MDKDAYISRLEAELDAAKAKYNTIYESVRTVDRVVNNFKQRHKKAYNFARDSYKKIQSLRQTPSLAGTVTHSPKQSIPLAKIYTNYRVDRLNVIFNQLDERNLKNPGTSTKLISAVKYADKNNLELRIITRDNLANPKVIRDFLKEKHTHAPKKISFYSDLNSRLAQPIHRLEVSRGDIFYEHPEGVDND